ncbi:TIGR03086 family metal-binding protein [Acrocarpospora catenulata]|uniref:TIGR03086 family metal-binding protein n=1 Tax=Acrocarpospora catenulata TaxID=2836182 RepID=UPI0020239D8F|nr:TIGR03086 family metal-binding protein [Acrocarpospora catenulata]
MDAKDTPMDAQEMYARALHGFADRVHEVGSEQWSLPTPCTEWNVRDLVNHLTGENRWIPPILAGMTIADVGHALDGDLLGDDPVRAFDDSAEEALAAARQPGVLDHTVHLSFGDVPGTEYAMQLSADFLIHTWDLAKATGGDTHLDPALVDACLTWFPEEEDAYRSSGVIGDRVDVPPDADHQTQLLAAFGRAA